METNIVSTGLEVLELLDLFKPYKVCGICHVSKPANEDYYRKNKRSKDGLYSYCKPCAIINDRYNLLSYYYNLKYFGYHTIAILQDWKCPVCGEELDKNITHMIDHDHKCCGGDRSCGMCIRGVIHPACNTLIGIVEISLRNGNKSLASQSVLDYIDLKNNTKVYKELPNLLVNPELPSYN